MSIEAEVRPTEIVPGDSTQVLIREARRRQRRRRLIIVAVLFIGAVTGWLTARSIGGDGSGPVTRPVAPKSAGRRIIVAGQFSGTWHVHTTSVTIESDGQGSVIWPGPPEPGKSEATAVPGTADLRLTSVRGQQATALVTGSTEPSVLPDGPAQSGSSLRDARWSHHT